MFRIRIDRILGLDSDSVIELCEPKTHVTVLHELPKGNPHYHLYVETDVKEQALRQRFKRKFTELKSTDYSIKKCDAARVNEYIQYLFNTKHGNKWELIDTNNFDIELLDNLKKAAKEISDHFETVHKSKKSDRPTVYDIATEISEELKKRFTSVKTMSTVETTPFPQLYEEALNIAIDICHKYKQPFEEHYLRRLVTTAVGVSAKGKQGIIRKIMAKEFSL